jgi:cardiolipin synthase
MPLQGTPSASTTAPERKLWLTVPNALTLARLLAIVPFAFLATHGRDREALIVFVIAGLTDTLDGTIARRFGQTSVIGRFIDPLADKLFTGVAFILLSAFRSGLSHIPLWLMFAVLLRDVLILCGSFVVYRATRNTGFKPSVYGKLNTFLEIGIVVLFLAQPDFAFLATVLPITYAILLFSLLISSAEYSITGFRMIRESLSAK